MFSLTIQPRFAETDALGHINNAVLPVWFEQGRTPIFRMFVPSLSPKDWNLILARVEVDYLRELFYQHEVEIRTFVGRIGTSSAQVYQEAWQNGELAARGVATLVCFDHQEKCSVPISEAIKAQLSEHLRPSE